MFCDTEESESCLVKAPAKHASESVLVVGELLCTGVQENTERDTQGRKRAKCAHVGDTNNKYQVSWRDSRPTEICNVEFTPQKSPCGPALGVLRFFRS